jgi:hypothetical protein
MVAMHAGTSPGDSGETSVQIVVVAISAGDLLWSAASGYGVALRVEHRVTDGTALGLELAGGRGDEGSSDKRHTLYALRGYGRTSATDELAGAYGAGLSRMSTGMWTLSAHISGAASRPGDTAVPYANVGFAVAIPLVRGKPFGNSGEPPQICLACERSEPREPQPDPGLVPSTELYVTIDAGVVAFPGGGNAASIAVGGAFPTIQKGSVLGISIADGQH